MKLATATVLAAALLAAPACKKKSNTAVVAPHDDHGASHVDRSGGARTTPDTRGDQTTVSADDGESPPSFAAVYFEFDQAELSSDARTELSQLADWLQAHPKATITIEGHTDDRGTDEYNVALGQRRAAVIQDYLARLGVAKARLATISFGEERPAATGEDEAAWAQNRRGELVPRR